MTIFAVGRTGAIDTLRYSFSVMAVTMACAALAAEPKVLVVNEIQVTDADQYKEYAAQVPVTLLPYSCCSPSSRKTGGWHLSLWSRATRSPGWDTSSLNTTSPQLFSTQG